MPKKILPLHQLKGLKGLDPDHSLNELISLHRAIPSFQLASKYYSGRGKYLVLHRWLEEQLFETMISAPSSSDELVEAIQALSNALVQLAQNQEPSFFKIQRQTGERNEGTAIRQAILCAAARFNGEALLGRKEEAQRWWASIIRTSKFNPPAQLKRVADNVAQGNNPKEKLALLAFYAGYVDATPEEAKEHSTQLKGIIEEILLPK